MDSPPVVQRLFHSDWSVWFVLFLISLIGLYFKCLSFRVVVVNTARPDGAFLFVVWFIHWKRMIRPFLFYMLCNVNQIVQQTTFSWMVNSWPVVKYSYTCCIDNFRFCLFIKQERSNHTQDSCEWTWAANGPFQSSWWDVVSVNMTSPHQFSDKVMV
jgi:hypothetical protein